MPNKIRIRIFDILLIIIGSFLLATSISIFLAPNEIAAGGVTGLSTLLHYLFGTPIGVMNLVLNTPLFIFSARKFGFKFISLSIFATVLLAVFIDLLAFIPAYTNDIFLSSIFGGFIGGIGIALVMTRGASTGGVDIVAKLLNNKWPFLSIGNFILGVDAIVVILSAIIFKNIDNAMYAVVAIFVQSKAMDTLIFGSGQGRVIYVNSKHYDLIASQIMKSMKRGVTILEGKGGYSNSETKILMCAVRRYEAYKVHRIIKLVDPRAFVITVEAGEVIGEGFKSFEEN